MRHSRLSRGCRRMFERLSQPSSAAGLAALLALIAPDLAEEAPADLEVALIVLAASAALVAMVRGGVRRSEKLRTAFPVGITACSSETGEPRTARRCTH